MKNLRKIILLTLPCIILILLVGCSSLENVDGSLEDIMASINEKLDDDTKNRLMNIEVNDENILSYLGTADIEYEEILASENMVSSIAHSVVLVRVKDGADIEEVKSKIKESINPRKWICVWVEDEDVIIKNKGNLIIAIVVKDEENRKIIEKGFDNL